jgi:hypothetical protein
MGMEISSDVFDDSDAIFEFAENTGVEWEGREVILKKFSAYANGLIKRIETQMQLLALDEKAFCRAEIHLARIGARSPEERALAGVAKPDPVDYTPDPQPSRSYGFEESERGRLQRELWKIERDAWDEKQKRWDTLSVADSFKDRNFLPPFSYIDPIGHYDKRTIHFHCGINNSEATIMEGGECLYSSLEQEFAIQPHLLHSPNIATGLTMVALEKLERVLDTVIRANSPIQTSFPIQFTVPSLAIPKDILRNSHIQQSIDYEVGMLTKRAQKIIEQNNPNLKQVHVTFSNGGHIFKEALKQLPPEYQNTIIVIPVGTTAIIDDYLACKVYNVIGDKDWPSKVCNGGIKNILEISERTNIDIIRQKETDGVIGGHYFTQPEYQAHIKDIINKEIKNVYEIYQ